MLVNASFSRQADHTGMNAISMDQVNAILDEAKRTGVFELYYIDFLTGLRRGEPLGLKWDDIDFKNGILHVLRQCPAHAPEGAETGRTGANPIPRSSAHLCHTGVTKWSRHENGIRYVGTLLRRLHPRYLRPCHHGSPEKRRKHHGKRPILCGSPGFPVWVRTMVRKQANI